MNVFSLAIDLERKINKLETENSHLTLENVFDLLVTYDQVVGYYFQEKIKHKSNERMRELEELVVTVSNDILKFRKAEKQDILYNEWHLKYQVIWLENIGIFYFTLCLFLISGVVGWGIGCANPSLALSLIPQNLAEMIIDHSEWFSKLQESPFWGGFNIAVNNIRIAICTFVLGSLFGFGGLILLVFNGVFFGMLVGYSYIQGFLPLLLDFVVGHGFLELLIIIASSFSGLLIGKSFYVRPISKMPESIKLAVSDALTVAIGVIPWLILAATVEGFVSPFHYLNFTLKLILGVLIATMFLIWTFVPVTSK